MSHVWSPQTGPAGWQSLGQLPTVSPFSHIWLPQTGFAVLPQSCAQFPTSEPAHVPSPQTGPLFDGASGVGSGSPPPPAHAAITTANTNASVDVLIAAHRTPTHLVNATTKFRGSLIRLIPPPRRTHRVQVFAQALAAARHVLAGPKSNLRRGLPLREPGLRAGARCA